MMEHVFLPASPEDAVVFSHFIWRTSVVFEGVASNVGILDVKL